MHSTGKTPFTRFLVVIVLAAVLVAEFVLLTRGAVAFASSNAPQSDSQVALWKRPIARALNPTRNFDAPTSKYAPGHRGQDYQVVPGTPVVAAGGGVVSFAGSIAASVHVVVNHGADVRTSYSFLDDLTVAVGDRVAAGAPLGHAGTSDPGLESGHVIGEFHFGLRVGDLYRDPEVLFAPVDLTQAVHLAPALGGDHVVARRASEERNLLAQALSLPIGAAKWLVQGATDLASSAADAASAAATRLAAAVARYAAKASILTPLGKMQATIDFFDALATSTTHWWQMRDECTAEPPVADGTGGSGHKIMVVAGINSHTKQDGSTVGLDVDGLGYLGDEVTYFSYAPDGGDYSTEDSYRDLHASARNLGVQLKAMQAADPGREVDLVAHSQGGVVTRLFLQEVYDPGDPAYPPLGDVITLSSPHQGSPLATAGVEIAGSDAGRAGLEDLADRTGALPPPDATSANQLSEYSGVIGGLAQERLPDQIDFTTIGAPDDYVVPGSQVSISGASEVSVDPAGFNDHTNIVGDASALGEVRLALDHLAPSCQSLAQTWRGAIEPVVISRIEHEVGHVGRSAGDKLDLLGELAEAL